MATPPHLNIPTSFADRFAVAQFVEHHFSAMGTWCHVVINGGSRELATWVEQEAHRLSSLWTRFESTSELSVINDNAGRWMAASPETVTLANAALTGWRMSRGAFHPFLLQEIVDAGYDADFAELAPQHPPRLKRQIAPTRQPVATRRPGHIRIAPGWGLDSGGIGKGLGADLIASALMRRGARGALVNLGGDLRCVGEGPVDGWRISLDRVDEPGTASDVSIRLESGGLATSSPRQRSWVYADGSRGHHLLNPRTGLPSDTPIAAVTAIAPRAWVAEVLAKAAYHLRPESLQRLVRRKYAGLLITMDDGQRQQVM